MRYSKIKRIISKAKVNRFDFSFYYSQKDYVNYMYYSDSYFRIPSSYLNKALLTQSLSLTMACFASGEHDYSSKFQNGIDLLNKLKFNNIDTNVDFKNKPNADSLGIVFASKKIRRYTIVVVVIRSANYESEWASNFKIGNDKNSIYHKGFFEASEIFLESLKNYLLKYKIKGKIKLWSMGFSRGAISNNIASGRIDEMIENHRYIFDKKIKLKKDNFYSFCFESPRGVFFDESNYPKSEKFNNIYCILNYNDPVTKVVPRILNCSYFGNELYLPDRLNNYDFDDNLEKVKSQFELMPNYQQLGRYSISDFSMVVESRLSKIFASKNKNLINWTQGLFLDELTDLLGEYAVVSRDNYTALFQDGIRSALIKYFSSDEEGKSFLSSIKTKDKTESASVSAFIKKVKQILMSHKEILFPLLDKNNLNSIKSAHSPELCLSFLRSMDLNYTKDIIRPDLRGRYYRVQINNHKATFSILADEKEIINYVNGDNVDLDNKFIQDIRDKKIDIYLPADKEYVLLLNKLNSDECNIKIYEPNENRFNEINIEPIVENNKQVIKF